MANLLKTNDIPDYAITIAQLGLSGGGLGILCPRLRAAPDVVPPPLDLDSPDVLRILSANACSHLQVFEKRKLCRGNKRDPDTGARIDSDSIIGDLLRRNITLLPFAIDTFGRIGPLARTFLFGATPADRLSFPQSRPNTFRNAPPHHIISQPDGNPAARRPHVVHHSPPPLLRPLLHSTHAIFVNPTATRPLYQ
jgi:hypothetical protein